MSKTKSVDIFDRRVWVWDNSHDIVVAHVVEVARDFPGLEQSQVADWRVVASVRDLGLNLTPCSPSEELALSQMLTVVRQRVVDQGTVRRSDLSAWFVLDDIAVSGGVLRGESLSAAALLDVVDGFADLVARTLDPDPPGARWLLGAPDGRSTIPMVG